MSYITTVTGKHFDPVEPEDSLIDMEDIAHALSLICRGNGHTKYFYSVAQHSLSCEAEAAARNYSREVRLGCLLHDASEAYLSDVTRPVKKDLPWYLAVEDRLQNMIWRHFIGRDLTEEEKMLIFAVDDAMLAEEFRQLMPEELGKKYRELKAPVNCAEERPGEVKRRMLLRCGELRKR